MTDGDGRRCEAHAAGPVARGLVLRSGHEINGDQETDSLSSLYSSYAARYSMTRATSEMKSSP